MDDHITFVSFVLGFVAILLSQFFRTYYVDMSEARLQKVATSVSELIEEGADVKTIENIAYKFSDPLSRIIIVEDGKEISSSPKQEGLVTLTMDDLKEDKELAAVFTDKKEIKNNIRKASNSRKNKNTENDIMIVGKPVQSKIKVQCSYMNLYKYRYKVWKEQLILFFIGWNCDYINNFLCVLLIYSDYSTAS